MPEGEIGKEKVSKEALVKAAQAAEMERTEKSAIGFVWFNEKNRQRAVECPNLAHWFFNKGSVCQTKLQLQRVGQLTFETLPKSQ